MKYRFLTITVIITMLLGFTVSAESYDYTISSSENFISTQSDDDLTTISEKLNTTPQELESYLTENNILYIAVSNDNKSQIKITALTDNFSSKVGDISLISDSVMQEFISTVRPDTDTLTYIVENNGRKYICVKNTLTDENDNLYTVTQYITICNHKTFYFSCNNPGEDTTDEINAIFESFKLTDTSNTQSDTNNKKNETSWNYIIINCGVVVFGVVAIVVAASIVVTHIKSQKPCDAITGENSTEEDIANED